MEKKQQSKRIKVISQYQTVFSGADGKAVLKDLCKANFVFSETLDATPHLMTYREGQRSVVLKIMHILKIDHERLMEELNKEDEL